MEGRQCRERKCAVLAGLVVVALLGVGQTAGFAQTVPQPVPSVGIGDRGRDDTQPTVDYQAWLTSPISNPVGHKPTGRSSCSAITPADAQVRFGDTGFSYILVDGAWYFAGYNAPGVTQVSARPQTDDEWKIANPYIVVCREVAEGYGWYIPKPAAPAASPAIPVAQHVAGTIPLPGVSIGVAPKEHGLTGLNQDYWVVGMPPTGVFTSSVTALGSAIYVEARPTSFVWDFGDGTNPITTTSPGVVYPGDGPTAIHHVYEATSSAGYTITLMFVLQVRYRVNGGTWTGLGPVQRPITLVYPVIEVRSEVIARG